MGTENRDASISYSKHNANSKTTKYSAIIFEHLDRLTHRSSLLGLRGDELRGRLNKLAVVDHIFDSRKLTEYRKQHNIPSEKLGKGGAEAVDCRFYSLTCCSPWCHI